jgi:hypothetical protein
MKIQAIGTLNREQKGRVAPPPTLQNPLQSVVDEVASWPGMVTTVHWHFADQSRVDGVDFYLAEHELGHLHLDGEIHLATSPDLKNAMVAEGVAQPFRYLPGWVEAQVGSVGTAAAIALFRRNYERLRSDSYVAKKSAP